MPKLASLAAAAIVLSTGAALADTLTMDGASRLSLSRNSGETNCWVETDCPDGEVCHASVTVDGAVAGSLADLLKAKVEMDPQFAEWGLEIYVSKNDGLFCDLTEPDSPRCTFSLNAQTAELEPPLSCE